MLGMIFTFALKRLEKNGKIGRHLRRAAIAYAIFMWLQSRRKQDELQKLR